MEIRRIVKSELQEALDLVWRVFLEFEAPDYSQQGVESFKRFIEIEQIQELIERRELKFWGAYKVDQLVGVIVIKLDSHVSMLFVDPDFHRKGIGSRLFQVAFGEQAGKITVNASPYAIEFYHRLGFQDKSAEQIVDGIRFTPMKMEQ